jgi:hypothetical protein
MAFAPCSSQRTINEVHCVGANLVFAHDDSNVSVADDALDVPGIATDAPDEE